MGLILWPEIKIMRDFNQDEIMTLKRPQIEYFFKINRPKFFAYNLLVYTLKKMPLTDFRLKRLFMKLVLHFCL